MTGPLDLVRFTLWRQSHEKLLALQSETKRELWDERRRWVCLWSRNMVVYGSIVVLMFAAFGMTFVGWSPEDDPGWPPTLSSWGLHALRLAWFGGVWFALFRVAKIETLDRWFWEERGSRSLRAMHRSTLESISRELAERAADPSRWPPTSVAGEEEGNAPQPIEKPKLSKMTLYEVTERLLREAGQKQAGDPTFGLMMWAMEEGQDLPVDHRLLQGLEEIVSMQGDGIVKFLRPPSDPDLTEEALAKEISEMTPEEAASRLWEEALDAAIERYPSLGDRVRGA